MQYYLLVYRRTVTAVWTHLRHDAVPIKLANLFFFLSHCKDFVLRLCRQTVTQYMPRSIFSVHCKDERNKCGVDSCQVSSQRTERTQSCYYLKKNKKNRRLFAKSWASLYEAWEPNEPFFQTYCRRENGINSREFFQMQGEKGPIKSKEPPEEAVDGV